ncbi:DUF3732 domain-containing protein [Solibacillus sp. FSL R5-0691]|uniref:DUF3732 domain-containing protein n=1 Tax=Solibacillus sp. FSL R5-0691 TaxID=2921653 RepID=UPI0030D4D2B0
MKFVIKEIILWLKNGRIRTIPFYGNKVNVITGDSGTGKSVIIDIIDYCFFASKSKIPDEKINENISWYGVKFDINDKEYLIARGSLDKNRKVSKSYYFSPIGKTPIEPIHSIEEPQLKTVIEKEFSIDRNVIIPYSGNKLKAGNKVSLRYFFMFNTQSGDTIDHSEIFFDKLNDEKYLEALHRIFDLATGIDTVRNIIIKEKINNLEKEITRLERRKKALENEGSLFDTNIRNIVKKAKEYDLIPLNSKSLKEDLGNLKNLINNIRIIDSSDNVKELEKLQKKKNELKHKIRSYNKFKKEFTIYRKLEIDTFESLKPINYIKENYGNLIQNESLNELLDILGNEMNNIKKDISNKRPFNINVDSELKKLKIELELIQKDIDKIPQFTQEFNTEIEKYIFIGEIKSKLEFFKNGDQEVFNEDELLTKEEELEQLKLELEEELLDRSIVIKLFEELIQKYLNESSDALGIYKDYIPVFNYKDKTLQLKKPGSLVPSIVGSSSNHMFMHLCFMLGLHELIIKQQVPYVPNFLILDQPSRPYYGEEGSKKKTKKLWNQIAQDDKSKITIAFKVLNDFISNINEEYKCDFQIIVFEHIPTSIWGDANLENVVLVDKEFKDGNALIPDDLLL